MVKSVIDIDKYLKGNTHGLKVMNFNLTGLSVETI
jgi:hypothetical protein